MKYLLLLLYFNVVACLAEDVAFPSGEIFKTVDKVPPEYEDPELTGSVLLTEPYQNARLSFFLPTSRWYNKQQNSMFRAHPAFIKCIHLIYDDMSTRDLIQPGQKLEIIKGFVSSRDNSDSSVQKYHKSGTAVEFKTFGSKTNFVNLVSSFLRMCPDKLSETGQDLGILARKQSVVFYLQGKVSDTQWQFSHDSSGLFPIDGADMKTWVLRSLTNIFLNQLSEENLSCDASFAFTSEQTTFYYSDESNLPINKVLGKPDVLIKKDNSTDFLRLMQYPSNNVDFPGCPSIVGASLKSKCDGRIMSPRAFLALKKLEFLVKNKQWKLKILEGWLADSASPSLANEGRVLKITLTTSTAETLKELAKYAVCAGFDYVDFKDTYLLAGVIRQFKMDTEPVEFGDGSMLMPVYVPAASRADYDVTGVHEAVYEDHPLFDATLDPTVPVGFNSKLSDFISKSPEFHYFRLHPAMVICFDDLVALENTGLSENSPVKFAILAAFMPELEERSKLDPFSDKRMGLHSMGVGLQLGYDVSSPGYRPSVHTVWRLAKSVASACAPLFKSSHKKIALGIYTDSVFVGMQPVRKIWLECDKDASNHFANSCQLIPPSVDTYDNSTEAYLEYMHEFSIQAERGWLVTPVDAADSCKFDYPPRKQDPFYRFQSRPSRPKIDLTTIEPSLEKDTAFLKNSEERCELDSTEFCRSSHPTRNKLVIHLWEDISTKHLLAGKENVRRSLEQCLDFCSGCSFGSEWDAKVKACMELAHWLPFDFGTDAELKKINIYAGGDEALRTQACYHGEHCIDWTPIYSLVYPTLSAVFRPNPEGAGKDPLYEQGNPSPLLPILREMFAYYAIGEVKVWIRNDADVLPLENSFKSLILYNKNVTMVTVYVLEQESLSSTVSAVDSLVSSWIAHACPLNSREYLAPFIVQVATISDTAFGESFAESFQMRNVMKQEHSDFVDIKNW